MASPSTVSPSLRFITSFFLSPFGALCTLTTCTAIGATLSAMRDSQQAEDKLVTRKVAQMLGEWTPPELSHSERTKLMDELKALRLERAACESRLARYTPSTTHSSSNQSSQKGLS